MDIHVSKYPWYPSIQLSKYPKKNGIQDIHLSGYIKKWYPLIPKRTLENLKKMSNFGIDTSFLKEKNNYPWGAF